jgi:serine-type D-Ala-D-Ala carboxypeptidase/endopeptidase
MKTALLIAAALVATPLTAVAAQPAPTAAAAESTYAAIDADFERWRIANHVPGMVWGVVAGGRLVHVKALGQQSVGAGARPVSADTGFRIASMSKAFTAHAILRLRDEGRLRLDDPVWKYIPEVKSWGADITVADLLHHTAGFVTDDPWGDRQQPMAEAEFTRLLKAGVPRTAVRGTRFEYSNLGYAMLGRVISNVTGMNFSRYIAARVFTPLGMASTTYENADVPIERRAIYGPRHVRGDGRDHHQRERLCPLAGFSAFGLACWGGKGPGYHHSGDAVWWRPAAVAQPPRDLAE